ncbi:hypothetical protein SAMN00777080_2185 [Aquiflexum balticum DSM 16537]|uniref:Lipoprotein n=1 Tax=Aquiflexum balticum DSM 16537 TaxID=758820 RepID=A0A1W2H545_9BACT|nr:hypothetical protein [Aquiflexum balticum]SMD43586.1 hypothetical protein SAMN00777080_2185 [Aquiflexum balticum DSM 16537]
MKKTITYLSILFLGWFGLVSCQDISEPEITKEANLSDPLKEISSVEIEANLIKLGAIFGNALKDKEAISELFGFAKLEGNEGVVGYSLKRLFEEQSSKVARKKSAIVSSIVQNSHNLRMNSDEEYNLDEMISFINTNEIEVIAPYLARNFEADEIDELTISWWTQEMEDEGLALDPNWPGETPAFKIKLDKNKDILNNVLEATQNGVLEIFMVGDEYAMKNPTIVFGAFDEDLYNIGNNSKPLFLESLSYSNVVPLNEGVKCEDILPGDLVRYQMPDFRIRDNTRSWPNGNFISIWVAYSAYNTVSGVPELGFNVNQIFRNKKIDRGDFAWKANWVPPLLTHWDITNYSIQIIVAHQKKNILTEKTYSSSAINPTTGITVSSSQEVTWADTKTYGSNTWYRCQEINGAHTVAVPPTNVIRNGNAVWQMQSSDGRCEFTLEPRLTRW